MPYNFVKSFRMFQLFAFRTPQNTPNISADECILLASHFLGPKQGTHLRSVLRSIGNAKGNERVEFGVEFGLTKHQK